MVCSTDMLKAIAPNLKIELAMSSSLEPMLQLDFVTNRTRQSQHVQICSIDFNMDWAFWTLHLKQMLQISSCHLFICLDTERVTKIVFFILLSFGVDIIKM